MAENDTGFYIEVMSGIEKGRVIALHRCRIPLGRRFAPEEKKARWILFADSSVQRTHAIMDWDSHMKRFTLISGDPATSTLINGIPQIRCVLMPGDRITLGSLELIFCQGSLTDRPCEHILLRCSTAVNDSEGISPIIKTEEHLKMTPRFTTTPFRDFPDEKPAQKSRKPVKNRIPHDPLNPAAETPSDFYFIIFRQGLTHSKLSFSAASLAEGQHIQVLLDRDEHFHTGLQGKGDRLFFDLSYSNRRFHLKTPEPDLLKVNRIHAPEGEYLPLKTGDEITAESFRLIFIEHQILEILMKWECAVLSGVPEDREKLFSITRTSISIGRGKSCDISLHDQNLARHQATIHYADKVFSLIQRTSTRLTMVNDRPVRTGEKVALRDGDAISFGPVTNLLFRKKSI